MFRRGRIGNHSGMGRVRQSTSSEKPKPIHATIVGEMAAALEEYASENQINLTHFIREAVREKLQSLGRFPRKKDGE